MCQAAPSDDAKLDVGLGPQVVFSLTGRMKANTAVDLQTRRNTTIVPISTSALKQHGPTATYRQAPCPVHVPDYSYSDRSSYHDTQHPSDMHGLQYVTRAFLFHHHGVRRCALTVVSSQTQVQCSYETIQFGTQLCGQDRLAQPVMWRGQLQQNSVCMGNMEFSTLNEV